MIAIIGTCACWLAEAWNVRFLLLLLLVLLLCSEILPLAKLLKQKELQPFLEEVED